jgi:hypothetical protein
MLGWSPAAEVKASSVREHKHTFKAHSESINFCPEPSPKVDTGKYLAENPWEASLAVPCIPRAASYQAPGSSEGEKKN